MSEPKLSEILAYEMKRRHANPKRELDNLIVERALKTEVATQ